MELPLHFAKTVLAPVLKPGAVVVDATVGKGHDTVFLAEQVGPAGQVYGFDIQAAALQSARALLSERQLAERVRLVHAGHEELEQHIPRTHHGRVQALMFNLGYLPGGDKSLITHPANTLAALEAGLRIATRGAILSIVAYPGHPGGEAEARAIAAWAAALERRCYSVLRYEMLNYPNRPPYLLAIEKLDLC